MKSSLPNETRIGAVSLVIADLDRSLAYYQQGIGLKLHRLQERTAVLGTGGPDLLLLTEQAGAHPVQRATGLYHFALLVPSRLELARTLQNLATTRTPVSGFADHAVSEAIYLTDPDGHGIEIYRDRPRHEWEYPGGKLKLTTEPFDMDGVLAELAQGVPPWTGLHSDTIIGHIHLQVANISASEQFYINTLGFDLMTRYGSAASFIAAGGYHHHIGMNTWAGAGLSPAPPTAARLLWYELHLPDAASLTAVCQRLEAAGIAITEQDRGYYVEDPSKNGIVLITTSDESTPHG